MSMTEDHWYIENHYPEFFSRIIGDDYLEAVEVHRELEEIAEDPPSEYEIDRVLDALARQREDVEIIDEFGGNLYDVASFDHESHEEVLRDYFGGLK